MSLDDIGKAEVVKIMHRDAPVVWIQPVCGQCVVVFYVLNIERVQHLVT